VDNLKADLGFKPGFRQTYKKSTLQATIIDFSASYSYRMLLTFIVNN